VSKPDYPKPWKHPACWNAHMVTMTRDHDAKGYISVATCECGWATCARLDRAGGGYVAQDDAITDHWLSVIAEADAVTA
jgi:hypothetical protein